MKLFIGAFDFKFSIQLSIDSYISINAFDLWLEFESTVVLGSEGMQS